MSLLEIQTIQASAGWVYLEYFEGQHFSVNFYFLNNDKSYKSDFFTIDTINDGLSYDRKKSPFSLNFHWSVPYIIFRNHGFLDKASQSDQRARLAREQSHLKEHLKLCRIVFSKVCNIVFWYKNFSTIFHYFYHKISV